jgi:hypothetical protein
MDFYFPGTTYANAAKLKFQAEPMDGHACDGTPHGHFWSGPCSTTHLGDVNIRLTFTESGSQYSFGPVQGCP